MWTVTLYVNYNPLCGLYPSRWTVTLYVNYNPLCGQCQWTLYPPVSMDQRQLLREEQMDRGDLETPSIGHWALNTGHWSHWTLVTLDTGHKSWTLYRLCSPRGGVQTLKTVPPYDQWSCKIVGARVKRKPYFTLSW